jgi:CheY-like chemotaxis protein
VTAQPDGPRVLVVDDTDEIRALIRRALAGGGYQVDVASSLAQARALDPARYDLLLVDAHLGAELGTDLIDELVADDPAAAGRCLVITGGATRVIPQGVAFLPKPFRPDDLISAVRALHQADSAGPAGPPPADQGASAAADRGVSTAADRGVSTAADQGAGSGPRRSGPATPVTGGPAGRVPAPWRLLAMLRQIRSSERAVLADFVHDGPIQDLAAATLALQLTARKASGDMAQFLGELQKQIDAAARSLRYLTDGDWLFLPPVASLQELIRQRTAWLPLSSVSVDIRHTCAALRAEAPLIADVIELGLFLMTSDGPQSQAHVCVQAGENEAEIVLTLTQAGDVRDWAAGREPLAELASILGGTVHAERSPAHWQVRITLPRQCAVDDRRH